MTEKYIEVVHRRVALESATHIKAAGGSPLPFKHLSFRAYRRCLGFQLDEVRAGMDPEVKRLAQLAAYRLLRSHRPETAAGITLPSLLDTKPQPLERRSQMPTLHEGVPGGGCTSKLRWNCERKLRHPNYLSAYHHALGLGEEGLDCYPCSFCGGIHVGHRKGVKRINKQIKSLQNQIAKLDQQRVGLEQRRARLLRGE